MTIKEMFIIELAQYTKLSTFLRECVAPWWIYPLSNPYAKGIGIQGTVERG
jgi:hypothetical protein